jgi:hypothetical protein
MLYYQLLLGADICRRPSSTFTAVPLTFATISLWQQHLHSQLLFQVARRQLASLMNLRFRGQ